MQIIKGKYSVAKVMIDVIDDTTREQIQGFVNHPAFNKKIVIMPDCHAGAGSCIGFTMPVGEYVMPQIVGVDIGCGMLAVTIGPAKIKEPDLDDFIKSEIPSGMNINDNPFSASSPRWSSFERVCALAGIDASKALRAIGTLGGGNHFIEASHDEEGNVWIIIHSGSRNFGKRIADFYQKKAREVMDRYFIQYDKDMEFMHFSEPWAQDYLVAMNMAQHFAHVNRWTMMNKIVKYLGATEYDSVESVHNYIDFDDRIIRKGAIRAHENELCIIPFNSADGSALCKGKGNAEWNNSAPHGAGRLMSRTKAFASLDLSKYQSSLSENGVYSSTANSATLDESPMAYKSAITILEAIEPTVEVVSMLKPFYNFKAGSDKVQKGVNNGI